MTQTTINTKMTMGELISLVDKHLRDNNKYIISSRTLATRLNAPRKMVKYCTRTHFKDDRVGSPTNKMSKRNYYLQAS